MMGLPGLNLRTTIANKQLSMPKMTSNVLPEVDWMSAELSTGTSLVAVEFNGGVVLGADTRTTTGSYIANRVSDKLTRITDKIYCCRSGSAADTQAIAQVVNYQLEFYETSTGEESLVKSAAVVFKDLCYQYRDQMTMGIIVAGWDKVSGGQVYGIPLGGMISRLPVATGGSGSTYIHGYVDSQFRRNMTQEQAATFVTNCLALAMERDCSSGGCVRLAIITEQGVEKRLVLGNELPKFFDE